MKEKVYDIVIVGAGPAGLNCALHLAQKEYNIAIVEKDKFPREKVCGDGLTSYVLFELKQLGEEYVNDFLSLENINPIKGARIHTSDSNLVDLYEIIKNEYENAFCHVCKRKTFDTFLFEKLKTFANVDVFESYKVIDAEVYDTHAWVTNGETKINAKAIVGSDGASSIIKRTFFKIKKDWKHKHLTVQAYFRNVGQIKSDTLEIFLNKEIIPGGIWIFPMKGEVCNVGMGMLVKTLRKNNTDIKTLFMDLIYKTKTLGGMFETAELTSDINVRVLPLGQRISKISKERILLLGDAISVVNPITGEGIGQAMNSGRIAALHLDKCLISNDFSKTKMKEYDKSIARKFNSVIKMSYGIQRLISFPFLSNRIANNYNKNLKLRKQIESLINDPANYSKIFDPRLYYRILVG